MKHAVVGATGALIVLVVLPRSVEFSEFGIKLVVGECRVRHRHSVRYVEGQ